MTTEGVIRATLAGNVTLARRQLPGKVSQRDFAERLGVAHQIVGRWERAESSPSLASLADLCDETGRDPAWFLTDHHGDGSDRLRATERQIEDARR